MQNFRSLYRRLLLPAVALTVLLLYGCLPGGGRAAQSAGDTTAGEPFEHYDAKTLTAQSDFDNLMHQLFLDEVDGSLISLHYTLADPAAYGITDYPITFGGLSLEQSKSAAGETAKLLVKLENLDSRLLRQDQLLTYRILKSYLTTQLSAKGLELYDQPLSSSLGIQAQLPILLSEYAFYTRRDVDLSLIHI